MISVVVLGMDHAVILVMFVPCVQRQVKQEIMVKPNPLKKTVFCPNCFQFCVLGGV
uniref:Uncharacterized protein n=1 Tax=Arundo donax TaxID=35708 RepID=A0A0A9A112_ARUDO